ncbi:hypothetical protein B0H10DRAFT_2235550 [Mycena sp. CBHHK59/15]|nr:hypothetical protein B0H10DRAFT_2235550 [Mycena sp. CBHHK59/15]
MKLKVGRHSEPKVSTPPEPYPACILKATERALATGADHILVISDLKAVLLTSPRSGQLRAIRYDRLVRAAMQRSPVLRITNLWTPAHIGTKGNELADDAAKAAMLLPPPP